MTGGGHPRLVRYIADAHAIEQQAVLALRVSPALAAVSAGPR